MQLYLCFTLAFQLPVTGREEADGVAPLAPAVLGIGHRCSCGRKGSSSWLGEQAGCKPFSCLRVSRHHEGTLPDFERRTWFIGLTLSE